MENRKGERGRRQKRGDPRMGVRKRRKAEMGQTHTKERHSAGGETEADWEGDRMESVSVKEISTRKVKRPRER